MTEKRVRILLASALLAVASFALLLVVPMHTDAAIQNTIHFQGKLANPDGTNVTNGSYSILFTVYDGGTSTSGGTNVWAETQSVTITDGVFDVQLGSVNTTLATAVDFTHSPLYLSLKVGSDAEMSPRILFTAAPYAMNAANADNAAQLGGIAASSYVQLSPAVQQTGGINISGNFTSAGTGANSFAGSLQSASYLLGSGPDLSLQPVAGGQSVVTSWWGLQLVGNKQSTVSYTPTNIGTAGQYGVIIPAQQAASVALLLRGASGQAGDLLQVQDNGGAVLAKIDATGNTTFSGNVVSAGLYNTNTFTSSTLVFGAATAASIQSSASQNLTIDSGSGGALSLGASNASSITLGKFGTTTTTAGAISVNSGANVPIADQLIIDNSSSTGVTTAGVDGLNVHYKGGAAAVEAAGMRVDYTPGTTTGGTWSGMRIIENVAAATGVKSYGLKLEGGGTGTGLSYAIEVASGWDIGIDVQSGGLQLAGQTDPAAPAANNLRIYAKDIAGRMLPKWVGPSGVDTPFQANLGFNRIAFSEPTGTANCSTGSTGFGSTSTGAGTCTVPVLAGTNLLTSVRRVSYSTGTTAGTLSYQRQSQLQVWRGNIAGAGGFFYTTRFALSALTAGNRAFVGLSSSIANPTNVDPTTSGVIGRVGMAINTNTGNWNFVNNVVGTAPTVTGLGASFPVNTTGVYELILYSAQNGSSIGYRVTDMSTGAQTSGSVSTNIPTATTFLAPQFWITNNAAAAAATMDFAGWYLESDN